MAQFNLRKLESSLAGKIEMHALGGVRAGGGHEMAASVPKD